MKNLFLAPLVVFLSSAAAQAQAVVLPNFYEFAEGTGNNSFPYRYTNGAGHYQQSYEGAQFPGPMLITEVAYRHHGDGLGVMATTSDFKMTLSYCIASWNTLNSTFANNVGAGATVVFDGVWSMPAFDSDSAVPNPFTHVLTLTTPFFYDPSSGDLLMDVEMRQSTYPTGLAGAFASASGNVGVNRIYQNDGNPTSPFGNVSSSGLITRFGSPGAIQKYGQGCSGSGGFVPDLSWTGAPVIGGQVALSLTMGLGGAQSLTVIGAGQTSVPIGGACTSLVQNAPVSLFIPLGGTGPGAGSYFLPGLIPLTAPPGTFYMQSFVADAMSITGFSASNGLAITVP